MASSGAPTSTTPFPGASRKVQRGLEERVQEDVELDDGAACAGGCPAA